MKFSEIESVQDLFNFLKEKKFKQFDADNTLFEIDKAGNLLKIFSISFYDDNTIHTIKNELKRIKNCHYGIILDNKVTKFVFLPSSGRPFVFSPDKEKKKHLQVF